MDLPVRLASSLLCAALLAGCDGSVEPSEADLANARAATQEFGAELKGHLVAAIKASGPQGAVGVCKIAAPAVAEDVSDRQGVSIARTSLKVRNPGNAPDEWERKVLEDFVARNDSGEDATRMESWTVTKDKATGVQVLRYMKAIPTQEVCTLCHGKAISEPVREALAADYPDDRATGFEVGDIRGAFTVKMALTQ
ncbi:Tll0287-like domain-containing protein [Parvibaculum sp. MBR-TMA-1.3b-4.2]|jgi:hypothetical protein